MGIQGLTKNINKNISPIYDKWILDRNVYNMLTASHQKELNGNLPKTGNLVLIIDASAHYYKLIEKLNWFVFDITDFLKLLKEHFHYLLSIKNLRKMIFVFDGVNTPLKADTEFLRKKKRILSNDEFFNQITEFANPDYQNAPKKLTPSPLVQMTYIQFVMDISKIYKKKFENIFFTLEADTYVAELANKYNGYVISRDSDFFIYQTPGFININSLEFPSGDTNDHDFAIKYELYTRNMVLNYFHLTDETLPIFATLCGNDYLIIENYPEMKEFIMYYNRNHRPRYFTNSFKYFIYKNIINFILDMKSFPNYNTNCNESITSEGITPLQKTIIENICANVPQKIGTNEYFKNSLIESVKQYNIPTIAMNSNNNNNKNDIYNNINDLSLKTRFKEISSDILKSYKSGHFYYRLLKVLVRERFSCSSLIEDINKECCWDVTNDMRKTMYELIKSRNYKNQEKIDPREIEEINRVGIDIIITKISITPHYQDTFHLPVETTFHYYLNIFMSNTSKVNGLPYYLIPVVASLRCLLKNKIQKGLYVDNNNYQIPKSLPNESSSSSVLYDYELKALLASSIAALTLTYLNESSPYLDNINNTLDLLSSLSLNSSSSSSSSDNLTIEENIEKTDQMTNQNSHYSNIYKYMKLGGGKRSLQLKNNQAIKRLQKNSNQFKNVIHVYAEFTATLIMNSYMLQVLKLEERLLSFWSFHSMYSYLWEGAYYSMIESFKDSDNRKVSSIFNDLYDIEDMENSENYLMELEKIFSKMLDAIID